MFALVLLATNKKKQRKKKRKRKEKLVLNIEKVKFLPIGIPAPLSTVDSVVISADSKFLDDDECTTLTRFDVICKSR